MATPTAKPDRSGDPVTVTSTGRNGVGRGAFRASRFRAPTRGVRVPSGAPDDTGSRLHAFALVLPTPWSACSATAGRLLGWPIPTACDQGGSVLSLATPVAEPADRASGGQLAGRSAAAAAPKVRRTNVRWRRLALRPDDWTYTADGLPTTTPARTFVDLAGELDLPDLVAVGDLALRRGQVSQAELVTAVDRHRRRRGVRRARRALELVDPRSESPQESRARVIIIEGGLPAPVPNAVIRDEWGGFLARGDLVYEELRIVVEYDGAHHDDPRRREQDASRRTLLREHGWYVVEVTAADLRHPHRLVTKVQAALRARGAIW